MDLLIPILIIDGIVCGFIGAVIGSNKNSSGGGFVLGFLLGPLGVIAAFALDGRLACAHCGGKLNGTPTICQHCQKPLSGLRPVDTEDIKCANCGGQYTMPQTQYARMKGEMVECPFCQQDFEIM